MTPSQKLLTRLRNLGLTIPEGSTVARTRAGSSARDAGAWSWYLAEAGGAPATNGGNGLGSQWPITDLLKGRMLATQDTSLGRGGNDIHIDPWEESTPAHRSHYQLWIEEPAP